MDFSSPTPQTLRARQGIKWNFHSAEVLPMWVAEMDFPTAEVITDALHRAVDREMFGYPPGRQPGLATALADFCALRYGWAFDPEGVRTLPEVLRGVELAIDAFSTPGSPVILPVPAYMPFFELIEQLGRERIEVPMLRGETGWSLDLEALDAAFASGAGTLILTNPHNPVGKAFQREELAAIARIVDRHGGRVVADEIHAPLVYNDRHLPYASVNEMAAAHAVTLMSTSKAWNLPGLCCAQAILGSEGDRAVWDGLPEVRMHGVSPLGVAASEAAYRQGVPWLDALLEQLEQNRDQLFTALGSIPGLIAIPPEATYLAWLDFRGLELGNPGESPASYLLREAKLALVDGVACGEAGRGFARFNFGTTPELLGRATQALLGVL
ncbi:cystathionine beta-lyase [Psychromicrobium silvestre]|uniref:cysteine-S-conjugate beta-lyase n=1 Tax=Psychromicrobium silvestre TaxID=1645614 RepID=A0A7Y9LUB5_9MICC|nr:aminotransferase class I/II-fold pyridoxal phosphate-dependent enzyme [Psychromicrobium silvestre]NYE95755.1 cystathionine beta-lyase [Psychromicrobium silvestre]